MSTNASEQEEIQSKKRSMTLDLDNGANRSKRLRNQFGNCAEPVLSSPDLKDFVLRSPEVEQFIKGGVSMTSTSSQPTPMSVYLCPPKNVTDSQAQFAKGFEEALAKRHQKEQQSASARIEQPSIITSTIASNLTIANVHTLNDEMGTRSNSSDGIGSDTSDSMTLKDEQTAHSSMEQINMKDQEIMKLERKRLRNRIAASKCRKKKLERISQLELQVQQLKSENQDYEKINMMLRNEVNSLQQNASIHRQHGCLIDL